MKHPLSTSFTFIAGTSALSILALTVGAQSVGRTPIGPLDPTSAHERVDPRTAITFLPFIIDEPGSYYLTRCLTGVPDEAGIVVNADQVTIDLNGFTLEGVPGSLSGIEALGTDLTIYAGNIRGWDKDGILAHDPGVRLYDLHVSGNGGYGLVVESETLICDVIVTENANGGIELGTGDQTLIDRCVVARNTGDGARLAGDGGIVRSSTFYENTRGIYAPNGIGWLIADNTASDNVQAGIDVCGGNLIKNNVCLDHKTQPETGVGIQARCGGNFVSENLMHGNDTSVSTISQPDVVARNYGSRSLNNFELRGGGDSGPSGSASSASSNWANIVH